MPGAVHMVQNFNTAGAAQPVSRPDPVLGDVAERPMSLAPVTERPIIGEVVDRQPGAAAERQSPAAAAAQAGAPVGGGGRPKRRAPGGAAAAGPDARLQASLAEINARLEAELAESGSDDGNVDDASVAESEDSEQSAFGSLNMAAALDVGAQHQHRGTAAGELRLGSDASCAAALPVGRSQHLTWGQHRTVQQNVLRTAGTNSSAMQYQIAEDDVTFCMQKPVTTRMLGARCRSRSRACRTLGSCTRRLTTGSPAPRSTTSRWGIFAIAADNQHDWDGFSGRMASVRQVCTGRLELRTVDCSLHSQPPRRPPGPSKIVTRRPLDNPAPTQCGGLTSDTITYAGRGAGAAADGHGAEAALRRVPAPCGRMPAGAGADAGADGAARVAGDAAAGAGHHARLHRTPRQPAGARLSPHTMGFYVLLHHASLRSCMVTPPAVRFYVSSILPVWL